MSYSKKGKQEKNRKKRKKIFGHAEEVLTQLETVNKQEQKQDKNGSTIKPGVSPEKQVQQNFAFLFYVTSVHRDPMQVL
eukprot:m.145402 g.145402  ORF g.145402 m.145402 type:complete len:79 (+) comp38420_c0_seq18:1309-1545(+)